MRYISLKSKSEALTSIKDWALKIPYFYDWHLKPEIPLQLLNYVNSNFPVK